MDACDAPVGYVADGTDCDDTDATLFPGGPGDQRKRDVRVHRRRSDVRSPRMCQRGGHRGLRGRGRGFTVHELVAGLGGMARGALAVTPGDILYIYVGGNDGYNGGGEAWSGSTLPGNGGGASDVRVGGMAITDRVIAAGGGGGASGDSGSGDGGHGGGGSCGANYCGGEGGIGWDANLGADGGLRGGSGGSSAHGGGSGGGGLESGGGGATATWYGVVSGGVGVLGAGGDGEAPPHRTGAASTTVLRAGVAATTVAAELPAAVAAPAVPAVAHRGPEPCARPRSRPASSPGTAKSPSAGSPEDRQSAFQLAPGTPDPAGGGLAPTR